MLEEHERDKAEDEGQSEAAERSPWTPPRIDELPPLTELTLATGDPIGGDGDTGGGGSTVF